MFGMGSLLRVVEIARDAYNDAFNRSYQFTLDPIDVGFPQRRGSESYFIRLRVEPWMSSGDALLLPRVSAPMSLYGLMIAISLDVSSPLKGTFW
jgi:hypothetical protein